MDSREAKLILSAYRPGAQDADDPAFAEALDQVRRDPDLERWFRESIAFDTSIGEQLRGIEAPSGLRENILSGVKVGSSPRWSQPVIKWAIAAALIVTSVVGALIWQQTHPRHLAGWQTQALDVISSLVTKQASFDAESHDASKLVAWLRAHHAPTASTLPQSLDSLQSLGCKTFSWNGIPVSVICFLRADHAMIHLVMTRATSASNRGHHGRPELVQQGQWSTATWREGDMTCMLGLEGAPDELRRYLAVIGQARKMVNSRWEYVYTFCGFATLRRTCNEIPSAILLTKRTIEWQICDRQGAAAARAC